MSASTSPQGLSSKLSVSVNDSDGVVNSSVTNNTVDTIAATTSTDGGGGSDEEVLAEPNDMNTYVSDADEGATVDNINAAVDDITYSRLPVAEEKKENNEFEEHIEEAMEELRDPEEGEVIVDADYSDADPKMMKSIYVTDPRGRSVHKKTILSDISSGREVAKSFDRAK